jgi:membrane protease YdiL (CAAX protease family)
LTPMPSRVPGCVPWGLGASVAWGFAAIALWLAAQLIVGEAVVAAMLGGVPNDPAGQITHAPFVSVVTIAGAVVPLAVIAFAVRARGCALADYLGLRAPAAHYLWIGLATLAVLIPLVDLLSWLAGYPIVPDFVLDVYRSARETSTLVLLAIALAAAAPVVEEIIFRGFLLPGLSRSVLGTTGALLFTSFSWALLHAQYQPFYLIQIVLLGIVFGWLRLKSGSTLLTILLHGLLNLAALVQAAVFTEWMS